MTPQRRRLSVAFALLAGVGGLPACGGGTEPAAPATGTAAPPGPGPAPAPAASNAPTSAPALPAVPALGAHGLSYSRLGDGNAVQATSPLATSPSGSMLLACVGRGDLSVNAPPTDNKGNTFVQIGTTHEYNIWRGSGTSVYACSPAVGGSSHVVSTVKPPNDEVTLTVVEVRGGRFLEALQWKEVPSGQALTSGSVTTTGPALLVAWWWGDASGAYDKTAVPNNGFSVIDSVLYEGWLVQGAVAVRQVSQAGIYNVTWAATPQQGAQLWLAAVALGA